MMVTPLYVGLLGLWFIVLGARVMQGRGSSKVSLGDGGDPILLRRIRGHANFAEYVPLTLLMLAVLELSHFSIYLLHALGIMLLVGRLLHGYAFAFSEEFVFGRMWGTILTYLVLLIAALACVYQGLRASVLLA